MPPIEEAHHLSTPCSTAPAGAQQQRAAGSPVGMDSHQHQHLLAVESSLEATTERLNQEAYLARI